MKETVKALLTASKLTKLPEGISEELIDNAIEKFGSDKVKLADLPKDDFGHEYLTVVVRRPDRHIMSEWTKWSDKSPKKADEVLVNSCVLSHLELVKVDDGLFQAAVDAIAQLIVVRKAIIKN